jgi:bifunctional enzyme CysN/CysC
MTQLVRLATAGSVDDGKSTLIGRLLYDTKAVFEDQVAAVERASLARGEDVPNLALLTDGLRAEREQGITIDVAYRYFATPKRHFILADTPGHIQYTRNMVTGASTADVTVILVDARKGVLEQSRRHAVIASLLGVRHLIVCVNKMDLVDWSRERFEEIREQFSTFASRLDIADVTFLPVSALLGDNVVIRSANLPWFEGGSLLHHLESLHIASDRNLIDARLPIRLVIRPIGRTAFHDHRGYAGTVTGGVLRAGDEIVALPSGFGSRIKAIWGPGGVVVDEAYPPLAVSVELTDEIDVGRGDMLCRPQNRPEVAQDVEAMLCWLTNRAALRPGATYRIQHTTRTTRARVGELRYRLDINTLHRETPVAGLSLNEIGRVRLRTQQPLMIDPYHRNRGTGSFILVDEATNATVAAGMILGPAR